MSTEEEEELLKWPYLDGVCGPHIQADVELLIGTNASKLLEPWEKINSHRNGPYAIRTEWLEQNYSFNLKSQVSGLTVLQYSTSEMKTKNFKPLWETGYPPTKQQVMLHNGGTSIQLKTLPTKPRGESR